MNRNSVSSVLLVTGVIVTTAGTALAQSNIDPAHKFAWGENIGWVNFDTSSVAPDQARFDFVDGRFRGFAWSENEGWINLDDAEHFVGVQGACCDHTTGTCTDNILEDNCQGGQLEWTDSLCTAVTCDEHTGACCHFDGSCEDFVFNDDCLAAQGRLWIKNTLCEDVVCEAIPTVSEWGLIVMTLLGCTAGTIIFGRRQRAAA